MNICSTISSTNTTLASLPPQLPASIPLSRKAFFTKSIFSQATIATFSQYSYLLQLTDGNSRHLVKLTLLLELLMVPETLLVLSGPRWLCWNYTLLLETLCSYLTTLTWSSPWRYTCNTPCITHCYCSNTHIWLTLKLESPHVPILTLNLVRTLLEEVDQLSPSYSQPPPDNSCHSQPIILHQSSKTYTQWSFTTKLWIDRTSQARC